MARSFRAAVVQSATPLTTFEKMEDDAEALADKRNLRYYYIPEDYSAHAIQVTELDGWLNTLQGQLAFEITLAEYDKARADNTHYPRPHPSYGFGPLRPKDGTAPILSSSVREKILTDPSNDGKTNEEMLRHIVLRLGRIHDIALELLHTNRIAAAVYVLNRHSTFVTDVWQNDVPLGYRTSLKIYQECLEKRDTPDEV